MSEFKVGDKVRITTDPKRRANMDRGMKVYCGLNATIKVMYGEKGANIIYKLDIDKQLYTWEYWMLEPYTEFKVGDKVKVVDKWVNDRHVHSEGLMDRYRGMNATILSTDITFAGDRFYKLDIDDDQWKWFDWMLKPCNEFKVGDKVKVADKWDDMYVQNERLMDRYRGMNATILSTSTTLAGDRFYRLDIDGKEWKWFNRMLEPHEEKAPDDLYQLEGLAVFKPEENGQFHLHRKGFVRIIGTARELNDMKVTSLFKFKNEEEDFTQYIVLAGKINKADKLGDDCIYYRDIQGINKLNIERKVFENSQKMHSMLWTILSQAEPAYREYAKRRFMLIASNSTTKAEAPHPDDWSFDPSEFYKIVQKIEDPEEQIRVLDNKFFYTQSVLDKNKTKNESKEENTTMNMFPKMDFGTVKNDKVAMSFYGTAIYNEKDQRWYSYTDANNYHDVTGFLMEGMDAMIMALPINIDEVDAGDVIMHNGEPRVVIEKLADSKLKIFNPADGTAVEYLPAKNPFGFNIATKIVSPMSSLMTSEEGGDMFDMSNPMMMAMMMGGMGGQSSSGQNPMGSMMQMMMMSKLLK